MTKFHFISSIIKSTIRFIGYYFLYKNKYKISGTILIMAEIMGIVEEIKEI